MNPVSLFPVPLFRFNFPDHVFLRKTIIEKFLEIEQHDQNNYDLKYPKGSYTSFYNRDTIFDIAGMQLLESFMRSSVEMADRKIGLTGDLQFTKSWFSINRKYSYHEQHHHCPNIWSGVYYVQAGSDDATISFINKNIIDTGWPYYSKKEMNTEFNSTQTVCRPESGMLLVFPSYLHHKVDQQTSDKERVTIAFNMDRVCP